jgi:hypothetical protein
MASRRMISTSLGDSEKFSTLKNDTHRLAYVLLVTWADAEGRFLADSVSLRGKLYTRLPWEARTVEAALLDMDAVGLIRLYTIGKHRYGVIVGFHEHNTIRRNADGTPKEEAQSRIPAPPEGVTTNPGTGVVPEPYRSSPGVTQAEVEVELERELQSQPPPTPPTESRPDETEDDEAVRAITLGDRRRANRHETSILSQQFPVTKAGLDDLQSVYKWPPTKYGIIAGLVLVLAREHGDERTNAAIIKCLSSGAEIRDPLAYVKKLLTSADNAPLPASKVHDIDAMFGFGKAN